MSEPSSALLPGLTDLDVKSSSLSDVQSMIIVFGLVFGFFFLGDSIVLEDRFMLVLVWCRV